jgi:hypothetical protein
LLHYIFCFSPRWCDKGLFLLGWKLKLAACVYGSCLLFTLCADKLESNIISGREPYTLRRPDASKSERAKFFFFALVRASEQRRSGPALPESFAGQYLLLEYLFICNNKHNTSGKINNFIRSTGRVPRSLPFAAALSMRWQPEHSWRGERERERIQAPSPER